MKKFITLALSVASLVAVAEMALAPGTMKHKYIAPNDYVTTNAWMTVSNKVDALAIKRAQQYGGVDSDEALWIATNAIPLWARSETKPTYTASDVGAVAVGANGGVAIGYSTTASGFASHAEGYYTTAAGYFSHAAGGFAKANEDYSFSWNGDESTTYNSHGIGTFNLNPLGGLSGLWIGGQSLATILGGYANSSRADFETSTNSLHTSISAVEATVSTHETAIQTVTNDNAQTRQIVTTWENFLDGSNVVFSITNYLSGTYSLDAAKMTIKELREGEYREVYNSRDEILLHIQDFKDNDFKNATNQVIGAVNAAIGNKADRDWGKYTSTGGEAPENTVYMTAPTTVFAGGLEYERVAVGEGAICVLTTHGAPVWTQGDEGTFKFQDDGGTNYFGFAKTDSYTIGANTDGIMVQGSVVTLTYNITMSGRPCVWYKSSLSSGTWEQLNLPDGSPVAGTSHVVTWEQNPPAGTQVCYINVGNQPQGYFRATVEVAGDAKFMTNMPADLLGGIICTNTATGANGVIKPTFDGTTVQWTWSAN